MIIIGRDNMVCVQTHLMDLHTPRNLLDITEREKPAATRGLLSNLDAHGIRLRVQLAVLPIGRSHASRDRTVMATARSYTRSYTSPSMSEPLRHNHRRAGRRRAIRSFKFPCGSPARIARQMRVAPTPAAM